MKSHHPVKLLTCCYCGARSTLPQDRSHALVCHGCGAPIRRIEALQAEIERQPKQAATPHPAIPHPAERPGARSPWDRPARRKKGKRKKQGLWQMVARLKEEAEDIFDRFD